MTARDPRADRRVETARALIAEGDHPGALSVLEQTLELAPDWPDLHFLCGEAAAATGQRDRAVAALSRYLALSPDDRHGALLHLALLGAAPPPDAPPTAYVTALFDEYAPRFDRSLLVGLGYRGPELLGVAIDQVAGASASFGSALDLGCGTGLMAERLRRRTRWLEGVDLSAAMVARAAAKGVYDTLHVAELTAHLAGETRRFELITAADVLIYLGDLAPFFAAVAGRLAPGGLLAVTAEAAEADGPGTAPDRRLRPSRRFAHSLDYASRSAAEAGLALCHHDRSVLRFDGNQPVDGHVLVFSPAAIAPAADAAAIGPAAPADPDVERRSGSR